MDAEIISNKDNTIEIKLKVKFTKSMLDSEENIQEALNEAGVILSEDLLERFDADGSDISVGDTTFYSKGAQKKTTKLHLES